MRPHRLGRDSGGTPTVDLPAITLPPRDKDPNDLPQADPATPSFPQPLQPTLPGTDTPKKDGLPGEPAPILPPTPPKKGGGGA